jgi:hypothetical protein
MEQVLTEDRLGAPLCADYPWGVAETLWAKQLMVRGRPGWE